MASLIDQILMGQMPANTPGINPHAPSPTSPVPMPTASKSGGNFLSQPSFLMNLLAQSGYSTMPQSPLGAIGRAGVATQQQNMQQRNIEMRNKLLERQLALGGTNSNVQSTFRGANGNMFIVTRDGQIRDTGTQYSTNVRLFEQPDGSVTAINTTTGQSVGTPVTQDEAADATVRGAQNEARADATLDLADAAARVNRVRSQIEEIKAHPGKSSVIGAKGLSMLGGILDKPIPGSLGAGFQARLDELSGGVFEEAYQTLKGGGAITEIETRKATEARTRLSNTDQSEAEWDKALDDYLAAVEAGFEKLSRKASGDFSAAPIDRPTPGSDDDFTGFEIVDDAAN